MKIEEVFSTIVSHMIEGIMFHDEASKMYNFLGLWGYARCQEYHQMEEIKNCKKIQHYYATHYFKLLLIEDKEKLKLIPDAWYKYTTQAVDTTTKQKSIKELMTKWVEWENSTKLLYQQMQKELVALNEIDAAIKIETYIKDVSKELKNAEKDLLNLEAINYDMTVIIPQQEVLYHKYKKKIGW